MTAIATEPKIAAITDFAACFKANLGTPRIDKKSETGILYLNWKPSNADDNAFLNNVAFLASVESIANVQTKYAKLLIMAAVKTTAQRLLEAQLDAAHGKK